MKGLNSTKRQKINVGKEEIELSLINDIIDYGGNLMESTRKPLEPICKFRKISGYNINIKINCTSN